MRIAIFVQLQFVSPVVQISTVIGMLLMSLPESRQKRMVSKWQDEANKEAKKTERRDAVLKSVAEGYGSCEEIAANAGLPNSTTYKILKTLVRQKIIREGVNQNNKARTEFIYTVIAQDLSLKR